MSLLFRISGLEETREEVGGVAQRFHDNRAARKYVGEEMLARTQSRMRRGVDINGKPFGPSGRVKKFGGQTLWASGALAAATNYDTPGKDLELFNTNKTARAHYEGATIRPTGGRKFLTIPLRSRGGLFEGAVGGVDVKGSRTGARAGHYSKDSTFFKWAKGKLFLMQSVKSGSGKTRLRALFLLVRSVTLPKREFIGFGQSDLEMAGDVLSNFALTGKVGETR